LKDAVTTKQKHKKKSTPLQLQQPKKIRSRATFWGPEEIVEAQEREVVQLQEEEEEKLHKKTQRS
jgi:5-methylcytosine-specific restriction endonuclease McrA